MSPLVGPTHRFVYSPDPSNPCDHISAVVESRSEELVKVLDAMEIYLCAAGFATAGKHLELVDDEVTTSSCGPF